MTAPTAVPGATLYTYDLGYSEEEVGADCANAGVYARGEADTAADRASDQRRRSHHLDLE